MRGNILSQCHTLLDISVSIFLSTVNSVVDSTYWVPCVSSLSTLPEFCTGVMVVSWYSGRKSNSSIMAVAVYTFLALEMLWFGGAYLMGWWIPNPTILTFSEVICARSSYTISIPKLVGWWINWWSGLVSKNCWPGGLSFFRSIPTCVEVSGLDLQTMHMYTSLILVIRVPRPVPVLCENILPYR